MARPFIKWVGGKTQLISQISQRLPQYVQDGKPYLYVEPFCGSAALALFLLDSEFAPKFAFLNDINTDLINLYNVVKHHPHSLIDTLQVIQSEYDCLQSKEEKQPYYYSKREIFNERSSKSIEQAALFIFLNRAGFNGLYRVNSKNQFNVPIGSYKKPNFIFEGVILQASKVLQKVELFSQSYEITLSHLDAINSHNLPVFFYIDPPYKPISDTASFTAYSKDNFNDNDQQQLKEFCDTLDNKGYQWLLSNSDPANIDDHNTFFDDLYSQYTIERVKANRNINSNGTKRGQINELLIKNY